MSSNQPSNSSPNKRTLLFGLVVSSGVGLLLYHFKRKFDSGEHLKPKPKVKALLLFEEGNKCFKDDELKEAVVLYKEAIRLHPRNYKFYCNLGHCYLRLQLYQRAFDMGSRAIQLNPKAAKGHWLWGQAYLHTDQLFKAKRAFHSAKMLCQAYGTHSTRSAQNCHNDQNSENADLKQEQKRNAEFLHQIDLDLVKCEAKANLEQTNTHHSKSNMSGLRSLQTLAEIPPIPESSFTESSSAVPTAITPSTTTVSTHSTATASATATPAMPPTTESDDALQSPNSHQNSDSSPSNDHLNQKSTSDSTATPTTSSSSLSLSLASISSSYVIAGGNSEQNTPSSSLSHPFSSSLVETGNKSKGYTTVHHNGNQTSNTDGEPLGNPQTPPQDSALPSSAFSSFPSSPSPSCSTPPLLSGSYEQISVEHLSRGVLYQSLSDVEHQARISQNHPNNMYPDTRSEESFSFSSNEISPPTSSGLPTPTNHQHHIYPGNDFGHESDLVNNDSDHGKTANLSTSGHSSSKKHSPSSSFCTTPTTPPPTPCAQRGQYNIVWQAMNGEENPNPIVEERDKNKDSTFDPLSTDTSDSVQRTKDEPAKSSDIVMFKSALLVPINESTAEESKFLTNAETNLNDDSNLNDDEGSIEGEEVKNNDSHRVSKDDQSNEEGDESDEEQANEKNNENEDSNSTMNGE